MDSLEIIQSLKFEFDALHTELTMLELWISFFARDIDSLKDDPKEGLSRSIAKITARRNYVVSKAEKLSVKIKQYEVFS